MRLALIALILFVFVCAAIRLHEAREKSPVEWRGVSDNHSHGAAAQRVSRVAYEARGMVGAMHRAMREHEADSVSRGSCFAARGATHISAQSSRLTASHKQCDNC